MHEYSEIKDMLCKELKDYAKKGEIADSEELKMIDMLTHSIKSIDTIMAMEDAGYSEGDRPYNGVSYGGGNSYRRGSNGRYVRDGYPMRSGRSSYRGYSRGDSRDELMSRMEEMMAMAGDDRQRDVIRNCMSMLEEG